MSENKDTNTQICVWSQYHRVLCGKCSNGTGRNRKQVKGWRVTHGGSQVAVTTEEGTPEQRAEDKESGEDMGKAAAG